MVLSAVHAQATRLAFRWYHLYGSAMARRKTEEKSPEEAPSEAGEFRIGRPEFRIGRPSTDPAVEFRIGGPRSSDTDTEFTIRPPAAKPTDEFRLRPPTPKTKPTPDLPPLPRGWEPLPTQPPWQLPGEGELAPGELRRLEKPKKRYRGLSAVRAYIDPDHVEEILDLLVFNAQRDAAGPGSVSGFLFEAVTGELERGRVLDRVGERYPAYSADGVRQSAAGAPEVAPRHRRPANLCGRSSREFRPRLPTRSATASSIETVARATDRTP